MMRRGNSKGVLVMLIGQIVRLRKPAGVFFGVLALKTASTEKAKRDSKTSISRVL